MTRLPPVPRWSPSTDREVRAATADRVRLLTDADTAALAALSARAPCPTCSWTPCLKAGRLAGPRGGAAGTLFLGIDDDAPGAGRLRAAVWIGSNVVPVAASEAPDAGWAPGDAEALGAAAAALRRRYGSIYGPSGPVLAAGEALAAAGHRSRSVRPTSRCSCWATPG